jgi:hypothetical protein
MRLIDAELYDEFLTQYAEDLFEIDAPMIAGAIERCQSKLKEQPTIDAVVLPCKLGDPVYIIRDCSCHVYGRWNNPKGRCIGKVYLGQKLRAYHCGCVTEAKFELKHIADFGKLVFLTREEAEAALAERKMNDA